MQPDSAAGARWLYLLHDQRRCTTHMCNYNGPDYVLLGTEQLRPARQRIEVDRKSTRLNSSHVRISYAVFCLKKKNKHHSVIAATEVPIHEPGQCTCTMSH